MTPTRPDDPELRESISFWTVDETGQIGLPRVGIEAVGANWQAHGVQVCAALVDGRVFRRRSDEPSLSPIGPNGLPTVLGAGPLAFHCVEPFRRWTMKFDGTAVQTSTAALIEGDMDGPLVDIAIEVDAIMAVPPWISAPTDHTEDGSTPRFEQLYRMTGLLRVGTEEHRISGTGLRIRRRSVRRLAAFRGHCWQSALFPSGRAFGSRKYPPHPDGSPNYNNAFIFDGDGELVPAKVVDAPWLRKLQARDEDVPVVLESARGLHRIEGKTVFSSFDVQHRNEGFSQKQLMDERPDFPALHQASVLYSWEGEETYGMIERSSPLDQIER